MRGIPTGTSSGNLVQRADAKNVITCYGLLSGTCNFTGANGTNGYDGLNRVVRKQYSDSTPGLGYGYDSTTGGCNGKGRLNSVVTAAGATTTYSCYDSMGRVTSSSQATGSTAYNFSYTYDLSGALASETYPSLLTLTNTFDSAGRVTKVAGSNGVNYASSVSYVPQGVNVLTLGNGLTETWTYGTSQKQPTQLVAATTAGSTLTLTWGYGSATADNGNVMTAAITALPPTGPTVNASQSFSYDHVNRLSTASEGSTTWSRTFGYDQYGNMWLASWSPSTLIDPTTPASQSWINAANNRLTNTSLGIVYDNGVPSGPGNLTAINGAAYAYDAENRLLTSAIGGVTTAYTYECAGRPAWNRG